MKTLPLLGLISILLIAGCTSSNPDVASLPAGDAARGEALYTESINGAPSCSSCHALTDVTLVGPGFANYHETASSRVDGVPVREYTYTSITRPADHVVSGFANVMYTEYSSKLTDQDIADLMAFLLTQ